MCTAITYKTENFYFGRTLDYDVVYPCEVVIVPRHFPMNYRFADDVNSHCSIVGMAYVREGYPLYFDGMNEHGLCMAGLNFVGNAAYGKFRKDCHNVAQFELIPFVLSKCKSVREAIDLVEHINITDTPFSEDLSVAQLHWLVSDRQKSITLEAVSEGLKIYDNPMGVLTNNPPFPYHLMNLRNYMNLSSGAAVNRFSDKISLSEYSRGMGAMGLPGDLSSQSRFIRASFVKLNSISKKDETESISQFFHVMDTVKQVEGCCQTDKGRYEKTQYTCCCNGDKGIYYYTTYENRCITAVRMNTADLNGDKLIRYPLKKRECIMYE